MEHTLPFREDGTFRIMQITDLHYGEAPEADARTLNLLRELIPQEKPDLIVNTGDTVYGENSLRDLSAALEPLTSSGIPWTFAFGNHDAEYLRNKPELARALEGMPGSLFTHDPASGGGLGNHVITLRARDGSRPWHLFLMDSGDYMPLEGIGGYGCVSPGQIAWYRERIRRLGAQGAPFGCLLFMHIPLPEYETLWRFATTFGMRREGICAPRVNSGFFHAMLEEGHMRGVFVGHDHVNDFYGDLFGITLGYGRKTGFGGYGAEDMPRGARIFVLREEDPVHFETYLRLEGGVLVTHPWKRVPREEREDL